MISPSQLISKQISNALKLLPKSYFSKHLLSEFETIKTMKLYNILSTMPKGVLQHCHLQCNEDASFYRQYIFNDPIIYIDHGGQFKLGTKEQAQKQGWKPIKEYIAENGEQSVIHKTIFSRDQILKYSGEDNIWDQFEKKIATFFPLLWAEHIFKQYVKHVFMKFAKNGYERAQFRALVTSLTEYDSLGNIVQVHPESRYVQNIDTIMIELQKQYPKFDIGIIYNSLKFFKKQQSIAVFESALKLGWKRGVGVDFVNYEDPFGSLKPYDDILEQIFAKNPEYRLPKVYHAGETNDHKNRNIQIALEAGTKRIGHGFNILQNLDLVPQCKNVCFQLNPVSNVVLKYVGDPRSSAAPIMFYLGLPITINPDDPGKFGYDDSTLDFFVALTCYNWGLDQIKTTIINSIKYALCSEQQKHTLLENFNKSWEQWLCTIADVIK